MPTYSPSGTVSSGNMRDIDQLFDALAKRSERKEKRGVLNDPVPTALSGQTNPGVSGMTQQRAEYPLNYSTTKPDATPAKDQLGEMTQKAQEMATKVTEQAREYGEKAQDAARNFKPYVEKSMREQPMATLAVASVIGFVLGALWKK
jgi:ElaB/YqjD/DUF883 family membrane-anchored ribosome-binding protein